MLALFNYGETDFQLNKQNTKKLQKRQLFKCIANIPSCLWRLLTVQICGMLFLRLKPDWLVRIISQIRSFQLATFKS